MNFKRPLRRSKKALRVPIPSEKNRNVGVIPFLGHTNGFFGNMGNQQAIFIGAAAQHPCQNDRKSNRAFSAAFSFSGFLGAFLPDAPRFSDSSFA